MLALLFLTIALSLTDRIIFFYKEAALENAAYTLFIFDTFQLTVLPVLYLYTRTIGSAKNRVTLIDLLHFVPFFFSFIDVLLNFTLVPPIEKIEYIRHMPQPSFFASNAAIFKGITAVKSLQRIYPLLSVLLLLKYRRSLYKQLPSDQDIGKYGNNWLLITCTLIFLSYITGFFLHSRIPGFVRHFPYITIFNITYAGVFLFYGIRKHEFLFGLSFEKTNGEIIKNGKSKFVETDKLKLIEFITNEKPFLKPDYSIQKLAEDIQMPSRKLSELINGELNKHFFDFINEYRIQYACNILESEPEKTVLEIAYESGFNTKSTFNRVFKNHTKKTPLEYRKIVLLSANT